MIKIKIADIPILIMNRYPYTEEYCKDYITDEPEQFTVSVSDEDIENERKVAEYQGAGEDILENTAIFRKIAEKMPDYDAFLFHSSSIELGGYAYVFTANSGVGKTTHTRLWLSEFGDEVSILNGDKPIVRFFDGVPYICGTPWQGKENYGKNAMKPLKGVAFLSRGKENVAKRIKPEEAVMKFMSQIFLPRSSPDYLRKTLKLADKMLKSVRLVELHCNMEKEAAYVSRAALLEE